MLFSPGKVCVKIKRKAERRAAMSTAVILAGGESRRMQKDKLVLQVGGESLLASAVRRFSACFDEVWLSVAEPEKYGEIQVPRVVDIYKGCGPMGGLHAALSKTTEDGIFLVAADLPYADPAAALRLIELAGACDVCLMADSRSRYEPLFAYYKKTILPNVEAALRNGNYKLAALLDGARLRLADSAALGPLWREDMLLNINYPEDYERLAGHN
jgi:molybdopterin-guanine dinucleotide biosynthesis protein A